ncbi:mucin-3B-like isoform X2 [Parasteatoda tepidariorum]
MPENAFFPPEFPSALYNTPRNSFLTPLVFKESQRDNKMPIYPPSTKQQDLSYATANDAKVQGNEPSTFTEPISKSSFVNPALVNETVDLVATQVMRDEKQENKDSAERIPNEQRNVDSLKSSPRIQIVKSPRLQAINFSYPPIRESAFIPTEKIELLRTPVTKDKQKFSSLSNLPLFKPQGQLFDASKPKTAYSIRQQNKAYVGKEEPKSLPQTTSFNSFNLPLLKPQAPKFDVSKPKALFPITQQSKAFVGKEEPKSQPQTTSFNSVNLPLLKSPAPKFNVSKPKPYFPIVQQTKAFVGKGVPKSQPQSTTFNSVNLSHLIPQAPKFDVSKPKSYFPVAQQIKAFVGKEEPKSLPQTTTFNPVNLPLLKPQAPKFDVSKPKAVYPQQNQAYVGKDEPKSPLPVTTFDSSNKAINSTNQTMVEFPMEMQKVNDHLMYKNTYTLRKFAVPDKSTNFSQNILKSNNFPSIISSPLSTVFDTSSKNGQYYHYVMNLGQNGQSKPHSRTRIYSTGNGLLEILNKTGIPYYKNPNIQYEAGTVTSKPQNDYENFKTDINDSKHLKNEATELEANSAFSDVVFDELDSKSSSLKPENSSLNVGNELQRMEEDVKNQLTFITNTNEPQETLTISLNDPEEEFLLNTSSQESVSTPSAFLVDVFDLNKDTFPFPNLTQDVFEVVHKDSEEENEEDLSAFKVTIPESPLYLFEDFPTASKSNLFNDNIKELSNEYVTSLEEFNPAPEITVVNFSTESTTSIDTSTKVDATTITGSPISTSLTSTISSHLEEITTTEGAENIVNDPSDATSLITDFTTLASKTAPTTLKPIDITEKDIFEFTSKLNTQSSFAVTNPTASSISSETEASTITLSSAESITFEPTVATGYENDVTTSKASESMEKPMLELVIQNNGISDLVSKLHNMPMIIRVLNAERNMSFPVELVSSGETDNGLIKLDEALLDNETSTSTTNEMTENQEKILTELESEIQSQENSSSSNSNENQTQDIEPVSADFTTSTIPPQMTTKRESEDNIFDESKETAERKIVTILKKVVNKSSIVSETLNNNKTDSYQPESSNKKLTVITPLVSRAKNKTVVKRTKVVRKSKTSRKNESKRRENTSSELKIADSSKSKTKSLSSSESFSSPLQGLPFKYTSPQREIPAAYKNFSPEKEYTASKGLELPNEPIFRDPTIFIDHIPATFNNDGLISGKDIRNNPLRYISDYSGYLEQTGLSKQDSYSEKDITLFPATHDDIRHSQQLFRSFQSNNTSKNNVAKSSGKFDYVDVLPYDGMSPAISKGSEIRNAQGTEFGPDAVIIIDDYEDMPAYHGDDKYIFIGQNDRSIANTNGREVFIDPSGQKVSYIDLL